MSSLANEPAKQAPTIAQGMQVFFVRRILHDRYTHGSLVAQNRGTDFFTAWSQILEKDGRIPQTVTVPSGYVEKLQALRDQQEARRGAEGGSDARAELDTTLSDLPGAYHELLESIAFADLFGLLQDEDLGRLMRISYPAEAAAIGGELGDRAGAKILHEAIARQLNKAPERLTRSDYQEIRELDLVSQEIRDLTAVQSLKKLHTLSLNGTSISDLDPLRGLSDLQRLDLSRTLVTDLTALGDMAALRELDLANTRITDLTPLKRLPALQKLRLAGTTCSLDALKTLTNLTKLSLANREGLADIKPLRGLTCLEELNLFGTAVSDLHPLEKMTALQELNLRHTRVSDLAPLRDMKGLQRLDLSDTRVGNLNPLKELAALQYLSIGSLKDEIDLEPLRGLPGLRRLSIVYSKVRSLQPLKGLSSLQALNLNSTGVAKEEIDDLQQALPNLEITDVDTDPRALH